MQPSSLNQANQAQRIYLQRRQQLQQQQHQLPSGPTTAPPAPEPGTLYIRDTFEYTKRGQIPHGYQVDYAQNKEGFQGPVVQHPQFTDQWHVDQIGANLSQLSSGPLNQQQALDAISGYTTNKVEGMLLSQEFYLDYLTNQGAHNSAVNLSSGTTKARMAMELAELGSPGLGVDKKDRERRTQILNNYAAAYDLDLQKFLNPDPKINGPERQKLHQGLIDTVSDTMDNSPGIASRKQGWSDAVERFEAKNNSVVIAAGNEGEFEERLEERSSGLQLNIPENFTTNIYENEHVTSVGATRWYENENGDLKEYRAKYSSDSSGIDIYASGSIGLQDPERADSWGTSFSAPKVAATMAELHRLYPNLSSAQIEDLMKSNLTHDLNTGSAGTIQVLDYQKNFEFLNNQTF